MHQKFLQASIAALFLSSAPAFALTIQIDYSFDSNHFFDTTGNPFGPQARLALEAGASTVSSLLVDDFTLINHSTVSATFNGATGTVTSWSRRGEHPGTGVVQNFTTNVAVPADTIIIYAGARGLSGSTLGQGGPGGTSVGFSASGPQGSLQGAIDAVADAWDLHLRRGEGAPTVGPTATEFALWGGIVTFDNDLMVGGTPFGQIGDVFHFDHTTAPAAGKNDFFSIALHEIGHVVGLGTADSWDNLISGSNFIGSNAVAEFGGPVPLFDQGHFATGLASPIYPGGTTQEPLMDPSLLVGSRTRFTELDVAALDDIGWTIIPEPGSLSAAILGITILSLRRRRIS